MLVICSSEDGDGKKGEKTNESREKKITFKKSDSESKKSNTEEWIMDERKQTYGETLREAQITGVLISP